MFGFIPWLSILFHWSTCYSYVNLLFLFLLFSCSVESDSLWPYRLKHTRLLCPPLSPRICSNSFPLSWWCYLTISSSAAPFFCLQSFPALGSFPMSQLFDSGGQSIGASASASVLPMNIQDWCLLGLNGVISLQSKGLSSVLFSTTIQKHQFSVLILLYGSTLTSVPD